jgi:hypothetical protein
LTLSGSQATEILLTELDQGFSPIQSRCDRQTPPRRSKQLPIKVLKLRLLSLFSMFSESITKPRLGTLHTLPLLALLSHTAVRT